MRFRYVYITILTAIVAASADGSTNPFEPQSVPHEGVHYFLAKDRIALRIERTTTRGIRITDALKLVSVNEVQRSGTISVQTTADPSRIFVLHLPTGRSSDRSLTVDLTGSGLLKSVNAADEGRAGAVLGNILRFFATAIGMSSPGSSITLKSFEITSPQGPGCNVAKGAASRLPRLTRFTLSRSPRACHTWNEVAELDKRIDTIRSQVVNLEGQFSSVTGNHLLENLSHINALESRIEALEQQRIAKLHRIAQEADRLKSEHSIDPAPISATHDTYFELADIPVGTNIQKGMTVEAVTDTLKDMPLASTVFAEWGVVLEIDPPPPGYYETKISAAPGRGSNCRLLLQHGPNGSESTVDRCNAQLIFYRRPVPSTVRVYGQNGPVVDLIDKRTFPLIRPNSPLQYLRIDQNKWSSASLGITFDDKGVPARIIWKSKSSRNAITEALATSLAASRDEYAATLAKMVEIDQANRTLHPDRPTELQKTLDELQQKKAVLDARLALAGAEASFETLIAQQQATAELTLVQSQVALAAAQDTRDTQVAVLRLQAAISRMNSEIELLKAKLELRGLED